MYSELLITVACLLGQLQDPAANKTAAESVEVRYARAQLRLAEANLNRVRAMNKRLARSVPSSVVAEYQQNVEVAKTRLEQATAATATDEFRVWLQRAEAEHKSAERAWKNAVAVNDRRPGAYESSDIERFRLRAEVAKLQLERGQSLVDAGRTAQLQWEIEMLENQVQRLKEESSRTSDVIHTYPPWRW